MYLEVFNQFGLSNIGKILFEFVNIVYDSRQFSNRFTCLTES